VSVRARSWAGGGLVLAAGYLVLLLSNVCDFAAGPDSSGYLGQARMLRNGAMSIRVAAVFDPGLDPSLIHLFTPYGFMRGPEEGTMVPTYPVGTSLHLAAGAMIGGWRAGPFAVVPLAAVGCLLLTVFIARRLGLPAGWAVAAAAILAAFPIFIAQAVQPVSDVLATLWALAAIACALRSDDHWGWAAACGAAFAIGVAVRPTNMLLVLPLLIALRCRWPRLLAAGAAAVPFALALAWYSDVLYGSPFRTGYGGVGHILSFGSIPPCLGPQTNWLIAAATPLLFPGGLFVALNRRISGWHRALLLS
jgi:4-amino-4-deoxy-L-arabinose transferase-like glycosyltransferase